ncbi:hypothetical protein Krac_11163 [Ktedonobacter racemifer DSM 44963]|uniref:Uncharacterized protein n=2 Tax=Ktedonobacter racemifer TaxID=363277 RepID=D6TJJ1_KTERA|nr:hypothetical protein Krac_11163 [Ktedonobacter racemifer DSM 44963]
MNDDLVPEERAEEYHQLLTAFRSSSQRRVPITAGEQIQILARVRERLAQATSASTLSDVSTFTPQSPFVVHMPTKHVRKSMRFASNLLVAVVVVGLILGSWALFGAYPFSKGTSASRIVSGSGPAAQTQASGLQASMHVLISGPYFLSELLPVDVSLTNHTHQTVALEGINRTADLCFSSALMVQVTAGSNPSFTFPRLEVGCTNPAFVTEVKPGQTITIHQYVPLTRSREVTLTMGLSSLHLPDPLKGHWPIVHMQVNPQVPQDRALSLQQQQKQVMISIPAGAKAHLLYMQTINCESYFDSGGDHWMPLSTTVLYEPTCPTKRPHWEYIVSAPGYSIVSGNHIT